MISKYKQKKKSSQHDTFFSAVMILLVLVVLGFLVASNYKISKKRALLNARIDELQSEIAEMQEQKSLLEAQIYQSGQEDYLEKEAREKFNLQKSGEEVVTILPGDVEEAPETDKVIKQWWNPLTW